VPYSHRRLKGGFVDVFPFNKNTKYSQKPMNGFQPY